MEEREVIIKIFTIRELEDFLDSPEFKTVNVLPISAHRGQSYLKNPRVDKDDRVMYVAYENDRIVAYRLVMPDSISNGSETRKLGWFSCIYVLPEKRGSGIAKQLSDMAYADWKEFIAFDDPVVASKTLYQGIQQFDRYPHNTGIRAYLRFNLTDLWQKRGGKNIMVKQLLKAGDRLLNYLYRPERRAELSNKEAGQLSLSIAQKMDDETEKWIERFSSNEFTHRSGKELSWVLNYPWILEGEIPDDLQKRYHFTAYLKEFKILIFKLLNNNNEIKGLIILSIRDGRYKLPYWYVKSSYEESAMHLIYQYMIDKKGTMLTVYQPKIAEMIQRNKNPFWLIRKKTRPLFLSKSVLEFIRSADLHFQDGDGDNIFT